MSRSEQEGCHGRNVHMYVSKRNLYVRAQQTHSLARVQSKMTFMFRAQQIYSLSRPCRVSIQDQHVDK
jgi:hypothetical protein